MLPILVNSLGFFLCLGFLTAVFLVWKQARLAGLPEEKVLDILFLSAFLSILVGRLVFIYGHWFTFATDLARIILFLKYPGFSLGAVVITMIVVSGILAKSYELEVLATWDIFAVGAAFFAVCGYLGFYLDSKFGLPLVGLAAILVGLFLFLFKMPFKKKGVFFLCYLIFQTICLLMATWLRRGL